MASDKRHSRSLGQHVALQLFQAANDDGLVPSVAAGRAVRGLWSARTAGGPSRRRWHCRSSSRRPGRRDPFSICSPTRTRSSCVGVRSARETLFQKQHAPGGRLDPTERTVNPRPCLEAVVLPDRGIGPKTRRPSTPISNRTIVSACGPVETDCRSVSAAIALNA